MLVCARSKETREGKHIEISEFEGHLFPGSIDLPNGPFTIYVIRQKIGAVKSWYMCDTQILYFDIKPYAKRVSEKRPQNRRRL